VAKKECPDCGLSVGVRTKNCPDCGRKFRIIKRGPKPKQVNWKELKKGDVIKCVQGTGPYWINPEDGEKIGFNFRGKYNVSFIDGRGIGAYPHKGNRTESGFCYIYMGKPDCSRSTGIHQRPHKVLGIQTEATVIEKTKKKKTNRKKKTIDTEGINSLIASL
jgi:hypothetical protein